MIYTFRVKDDRITCTNQNKTIVSDGVNYHVAKFIFDDDTWEGFTITPIFRNTRSNEDATSGVMLPTNECLIPFEPLEFISIKNKLNVGLKGTKGNETKYTWMDDSNRLLILESIGTHYVTPSDPPQYIYDQILAVAQDKTVDSIFIDPKTILTTDWITASDIINITPNFNPTIVTNTTLVMRVGTFNDYLDTVAYPYTDFHLYYSTDGINTSNVVASGQTVANQTQRKIQFNVGANVYEVQITASEIRIKRSSGTETYYIHNVSLFFADYYYYDYQINGLTEYYRSSIFVYDESRDYVTPISFNRNPNFTGDTIRLNLSQKPSVDIITKFFAFKTNKVIGCTEICNTEGNSIYYNVASNPITFDDHTQDRNLATIELIKDYLETRVVEILQSYGLIP